MTACDMPIETRSAIDLLFADMDKLGPGDDAQTLYVLRSVPRHRFDLVVDAGCGVGRQTFVLARELKVDIYAVDSHQPFLDRLTQQAEQNGLAHLVRTRCMDMTDIPYVFRNIDLLWSEGAAYNIGFPDALTRWAKAISPGGFAVVNELCWLRNSVPDSIGEFFRFGYPNMKSVPENIEIAERAGYEIFNIYALPEKAWIEDYYEILGSRAKSLINHANVAVRNLALETIKEIEAFRQSEGSYGYVFFVLRRKR
jgi:SAM-dependent methyltransferase